MDTTGEKDFEEFFTEKGKGQTLICSSSREYQDTNPISMKAKLAFFENGIEKIKQSSVWKRSDLVALFHEMIPEFRS